MAFENPLAEFGLPFVEGEIPVGCLAHLDRFAGEGRAGIDEVGHVERRTTGLALVAVGVLVVAAGAGADHVAVGEELTRLFVVGLEGCLHGKLALVVETAEKFRRCLVVELGSGA